jgi:hypothetical protein
MTLASLVAVVDLKRSQDDRKTTQSRKETERTSEINYAARDRRPTGPVRRPKIQKQT